VTVVELDEKGRALLPAPIRKKLGARRFEVKLLGDRIELLPVQDFRSLKGKYRNRLRTPWAKLEEKTEKFVRNSKR
jgi:bifunctional DNA-binding transcriptional regulator/antitoxin component of YhaV-PrlF toxin-antitoxin module